MVIGGLFFGLTAASFTTVFTSRNAQKAKYQDRMARLREYLMAKNIDPKLRKAITVFYDSYYGSQSVFDEKSLLSRLPLILRTQVSPLNKTVMP